MIAINRRLLGRMASRIFWLLILGFLGYRVWPQVAAAFAWSGEGTPAPEFRLQTLAGDSVSLADLEGKVVLVNFWATWCPPCRVEMPAFERVYRDRHDQGFEIVGLSTDRAGQRVVEDFISARALTFPNALATRQVVHDFGGVRVLPTSFLIDRQGRIRQQVRGIFAEPALRLAVNRLLAEEAEAHAGGDP